MSEVSMTDTEREEFLADLHVGVVSIDQCGRPPLTVPIWYDYQPGGEIKILTPATSAKGRLLSVAWAFSLCVQTETRPYRYLSVEGSVTATRPADTEEDLRPIARRYLGVSGG